MYEETDSIKDVFINGRIKRRANFFHNFFNLKCKERTPVKIKETCTSYRRRTTSPNSSCDDTLRRFSYETQTQKHAIISVIPRTKSYQAPLPPINIDDNYNSLAKADIQNHSNQMCNCCFKNKKHFDVLSETTKDKNIITPSIFNKLDRPNITEECETTSKEYMYFSESIVKECVIHDKINYKNFNRCKSDSISSVCNDTLLYDTVPNTENAPYSKMQVIKQYNSSISNRRKSNAHNTSECEITLTLSPESSDNEILTTQNLHSISEKRNDINKKNLYNSTEQSLHLKDDTDCNLKDKLSMIDKEESIIDKHLYNSALDRSDSSNHISSTHTSLERQLEPDEEINEFSQKDNKFISNIEAHSAASQKSNHSNQGVNENNFSLSDNIIIKEYDKLKKMFTKWEMLTTGHCAITSNQIDFHHFQKALIDQQKLVYNLWTGHINRAKELKDSTLNTSDSISNLLNSTTHIEQLDTQSNCIAENSKEHFENTNPILRQNVEAEILNEIRKSSFSSSEDDEKVSCNIKTKSLFDVKEKSFKLPNKARKIKQLKNCKSEGTSSINLMKCIIEFPKLKKVPIPREKCGIELGNVLCSESVFQTTNLMKNSETISTTTTTTTTTTTLPKSTIRLDIKKNSENTNMIDVRAKKLNTPQNNKALPLTSKNVRTDLMEAIRQAGGFEYLKKSKNNCC